MTQPKRIQAMHDRLRIIEHQLHQLNQQIQQRQDTSQRILTDLNRQLESYREAKTNPQAMTDLAGEIDFHRAKADVQQLIRETRQEISNEEVACWNDIQQLVWEKRTLEREKAQLETRLQHLRGGDNDA